MAKFLETSSSKQQHALELKVSDLYQELKDFEIPERDELLLLLRDRHARYLSGGLGELPAGFMSLDASRPWICYWILHGLALLDQPLPRHITAEQITTFLSSCQHPDGGYGGGPGHIAHLAPTYAAVSALLTLGGEEAYRSINRQKLWDFLCRMAVPPEEGGGFRMHEGGECDARSCYTALAVASNLSLDVPSLVARSGVVDYIRRCQTYEGGLGGEPGNEAHGGYTFCGLAALIIAGCPQALDLPRLLHWATQRQGWVEGGFNGRTNKLVDGCYSFWQGGVFPLLQQVMQQQRYLGQVPENLDACCSAPTYPPTSVPHTWRQQQQLAGHRLVVPDLPDLSKVVGPVQQAEWDAERLNAACDALAEAAINVAASQQEQQQGQPEQQPAAALDKQQLLGRAQVAQQAAEHADENVSIAALSAAMLFACQDTAATTTAPSSPEAATVDLEASCPSNLAANAADLSPSSALASNPYFNIRALQLWILRACQQLKGGLRDKPGKPADYYHSCYCLSGLSVAQHMPGGAVLGPERNELKKTDPIANISIEKLQQAKAFFERL